ncbi:uncharacterized protein LOC135396162 [Ornithodoros turicata]|uniref:uncharacterized protein LOC135396162 n=1 Tax=Ornithodoros turicata TaxID=34597 RepID=UPI0031393680
MGGFVGGLGGGHGGGHGGGVVLLKGGFSGGFGGGQGGGHGFHGVQALQGPTYLVKTVHHVQKLDSGGGHLGGHGGSFGGGLGGSQKVVFLGGTRMYRILDLVVAAEVAAPKERFQRPEEMEMAGGEVWTGVALLLFVVAGAAMGGFVGGLGGGHGGGHGGGVVLLKGGFSGGFGGGHGFHGVQALQGPTYLVKTVHHVHKLHSGGGHLGGHGGGFGGGHKVVFLGGHGHGWHGR